ncbi:hypothetical protein CVU75_00435 [Candidatus Dependentiae bacterium HGW-Dependentiae-1]|nr:MAG: hypothetical protein CVU75_00435 [Candidatus Dependentiae bacterium HGW-Dependentiae-1]
MRYIFLACLCLVSVVFFFSIKSNSEVVYRGQTKEEAFSFVMDSIKKFSWYRDKGYAVSLPVHTAFEELCQKSELLEGKDTSFLRQFFCTEIYDAAQFAESLDIIRQTAAVVQKALQKLTVLGINWGFKVKPRYDIVLTLYGPGGNYMWTDDVGTVVIKIDASVSLKSKEWYLETIVHEMVHIGIEEDIVQKNYLSHGEKERLVDLICSFYLIDLLSGYKNQEEVDKKIDSFIDEKIIRENLPAAIEAFIAQYPRESSALC